MSNTVFFDLSICMQPFLEFRLLAELHAGGLFCAKLSETSFNVFLVVKYNHCLMQVYMCNTAIVARIENKLVVPE